jgi:beta-glucosidase
MKPAFLQHIKTIAAILVLSASFLKAQNAVIEKKIDSLLSIMTIDEKIGQVTQLAGIWSVGKEAGITEDQKAKLRSGSVGSFLNTFGARLTRDIQKIAVEETRLKIPVIFGYDVIHGYKTTFPIPLAEAASWDPEAVQKSARVQAVEASSAGVHWTFAPMVDIARDPRWGRIAEGSGEDPFLGSVMAKARVSGFQGESFENPSTIMACAKHFAAYGAAIGGRDYNTVEISERELRDIYLPPFKAAAEAGAGSFMCSFNEISGIPSSANKHLLTDIFRNEWKSDGFIVSDWNSIGELVNHGIATDQKEAARLGLTAGVDMDMESYSYFKYAKELISEGKLPEKFLDESVRRVLRAKFKLGLFQNPYRNCNTALEKENTLTKENIAAALDMAQKSIVLLKNENSILPIGPAIKKIAVLGPLAVSKQHPLGSWEEQGDSNNVVTVVEGLRNYLPEGVEVKYSKGCEITGSDRSGFGDAVSVAKEADLAIVVVGEEGHMCGEAASRASVELPGAQEDFVKEIYKSGTPVIVVLMNGRPLAFPWISENIPAIVEAWFLGLQSGNAIAGALTGKFNPSGKLPVSFPRATGQIPVYYNHKNTGRPANDSVLFCSRYLDSPVSPLYPFGYGLSYTTFTYSNMKLSSPKIYRDDTLKISVDVKNAGSYDGTETAQLYIRDDAGSVTRPVLELKGFRKISLKKGETKTVDFLITEKDLSFYNIDMNFTAEPGTFTAYTGTNSADLLSAKFELMGR